MAHPGSPPRRMPGRPDDQRERDRGRPRRAARPERPHWQADAFGPDETDVELPPWAEPAGYAVRTGGTRRAAATDPHAGGHARDTDMRVDVGQHSDPADAAAEVPVRSRMDARRQGRAAAARLRKSRRRIFRWTAVGVVVCVVGAVIAVLATQSSPKPTPYVTSLLPGEFKSVPSACGGVSASVLGQYLPGHRTTTNQFSGATNSQCSFTVDAKPVFRLLEVTAQAFQPFAAASGNGSASANATDSFAVAKATLAKPPKKSLLSPAQLTTLPQLGQQAFAATQREQASGIVSDVVTVVVRDRNVLITVVLSAQETPGFSPTPVGTLQAGATSAAQDMLARLKTQPVA